MGCFEPKGIAFLDGTPATKLMGRVSCQVVPSVTQLMKNKSVLNFLCCTDAPCTTVGNRREIS